MKDIALQVQANQVQAHQRLLPVRTPEDIELLVKESEIVTGHTGRVFVIASADRLAYRVHWRTRERPLGLLVERLGPAKQILCAEHLPLWEFLEHPLMEALATRQLYTVPLPGRP
jgi:hypothetical protein